MNDADEALRSTYKSRNESNGKGDSKKLPKELEGKEIGGSKEDDQKNKDKAID
jgi:hypothetical protein